MTNLSVYTKCFLRGIVTIACLAIMAGCEEGGSSADGSRDTGTGGSTARMTIVDDYLYAIAGQEIQLFDISSPETPNPWVRVPVDWGIDTLFPHGNYLLIGADNGMHIMDNSDPANPVHVGDFQHARSIDPVVASGNIAYVTLRAGEDRFGGFGVNELNVIDISNVESPQLVKTFAMQSPSGLAVTENRLFVCDGLAGLKIFDRTDPIELVVADVINDLSCNDLIVAEDILYVITDDKLLQYDHQVNPAMLLSSISVLKSTHPLAK